MLTTNEDDENDSDEERETASLELELKLAMLRKYNEVIRKRYKLKQFIRDFGLINELGSGRIDVVKPKVTYTSVLEQDKLVNFEMPCKFQRLFPTCTDYLKWQALLDHRNSLIQRLSAYHEYRAKGLTANWQISIYKSLKTKRVNRLSTSVHMDSLLSSMNRLDHDYNREKCKEWFKAYIYIYFYFYDFKIYSIPV